MKALIVRYLSVVYDALLMLALSLALTGLYCWAVGDASHGGKRLGLQWLLWLAMGGYFVHSWTVSGQTVASQAWKLKLVDVDGQLLTTQRAMRRYVLASVLLLAAGLGLWWALVDKEHCFLHDRLLGTRWIKV